MTAHIFQIVDRERPNATAWVHVDDFTCIPAGTMDAEDVMQADNMTLYTIDTLQQQFVFVETDPDVDLTNAPFYFQAQFEYAQRLVKVPFETLHALADSAVYGDDQLILLYSVGRCGSTLLSDGFNQLDGVASLSEPDIFTSLMRVYVNTQDRTWLARFVKTAVIALMKPHDAQKYAIKFRSYCIELADVIYSQFPNAHALFMYRNAEDWARSTARAFAKLTSKWGSVGTDRERAWAATSDRLRGAAAVVFPKGAPTLVTKSIKVIDKKAGVLSEPSVSLRRTFYPAVEPFVPRLRAGELSRIEYITLEWVSGMVRYLALRKLGVPLLPFRYEDLLADPTIVLGEVCLACGLSQRAVAPMLSVFDKDSQRGTSLARDVVRQDSENQLTERHLSQLRATIGRFPEIGTPHVILPDSVSVNRSHR